MPCCALPWLHVDVIWVSKWFQSHTIWCGKLMLIGDSRMSQNRSACLNDFKYVYFFSNHLNHLIWDPEAAEIWNPLCSDAPILSLVGLHPHFGCSMRLNEAQWGSMFPTFLYYIYIFIASPCCLADYGMLVSQDPPFDWLKPAINNLKSILKLPPNAWNPLALSHDVP